MSSASFAAVLGGQNAFSRKFGTTASAVDPYISGYFFTQWAHLPAALPQYISIPKSTTGSVPTSNAQINNTLSSLVVHVALPAVIVSKTELTGLGGVRWGAPTHAEQDTTLSMRFYELSGLPVSLIFHGWVRMIRDYRSGVSGLTSPDTSPTFYSKSNYASSLYYWTTKPDGLNVEFSALATGLFPMKDPADLFGHDITTNDRVEIDIDFNVDYLWRESWVEAYCQNLAATNRAVAFGSGIDGGGTIDQYGQDDGSTS